MSQKARILAFLQSYGRLTTMEAYQYLGITCCGQRITDLKRDGHDIRTTFGEGKHAIWVLAPQKPLRKP